MKRLTPILALALVLMLAGVATSSMQATGFTAIHVGADDGAADQTLASGDLEIDDDLFVDDDATVSGDLTVTGSITASVSREVRLIAGDFISNAGSGANAIIGSANAQGWALDADSDESISSMFKVPTDWDSSTDFTCNIYWSSTDTSGNDAIFDLITVPTAEGEDAGLAGNTDSVTDTDSTTADDLNVTGDMTVAASTEFASGDLVYVTINRDANNGSDSLTADASVHALVCGYTATR